jgi:glycosyltransferase involved in cell wall biosynthesis
VHILFLSDNFPPEVNAPASRTHEHCRLWAQAGHRVTVITCAPNFPKGQLFPGYKNALWQTEMMDGIRVVRVWSYITAQTGMRARFTDYNSYVVMAGVASLFVGRVNVVVGTSPQFFTAIGAWIIGMVKRSPWVFELRDIWPESIKAVGEMQNAPRALRWLENIELFLYRRADRIVSVTHSFRRSLGARGIDMSKIDVVTNGVDVGRFKPRAKDEDLVRQLGLEGRFVAGYIGTHGMAHALETLLLAAQQVKALPGGEDFRFLFLGDGTRKEALKRQAHEMGLDNVVFVDSVPKDEVVRYWSLLDVSIIHLRRTELFTTVIPSKLFECMGMGLPVLHGVAGESAEIVEREGVGRVFEPENVGQLVDALVELRSDPALRESLKQRGLQAALRYDRKHLGMQMLGVLEALGGNRQRLPAQPDGHLGP